MAPRILLCGDVRGNLTALFKRVSTVNKANGPFNGLLCVGQFFPDGTTEVEDFVEFIEQRKEIPLPTYFIGDYGEDSGKLLSSAKANIDKNGLQAEGVPVCRNLFWLKGSGVFELAGLRVAYLGGKLLESAYHNPTRAQSNGSYNEDDVDALRALADEPGVVDFFLTNEWPSGILKGVASPPSVSPTSRGNDIVAQLVAEIRPRYHVAGSEGIFYSREPYLNENSSHITRFIGLAAVANENKQKFLHALSPAPATLMASSDLAHRPPNTTTSPFKNLTSQDVSGPKLATLPANDESEGQYWRFSSSQSKRQKFDDEGAKRPCFEFMSKGSCFRGDGCSFQHDKRLPKGACFDFIVKGRCERGQECRFWHGLNQADDKEHLVRSAPPCWFCLASPKVETHLVVSVGNHCYCALAKGGLVEGHVIVLPIEHCPSIMSLPPDVVKELHNYKHALKALFKKQGNTMLAFERYLQLNAGMHSHLQIMPIPMSKASNVRGAFLSAAKKLGFDFHVIPPGDMTESHESLQRHLEGFKSYFYVELPEGTTLVHVLEPGESIPMQLGREVCAKLLGVPERSDWKTCTLSETDEMAAAQKFKEQFEAYNPIT